MATDTTQSRDESSNDGPFTRWVQRTMSDQDAQDRLYRGLFYASMIFFLITTLFPFYWLLVLSISDMTPFPSYEFPPVPNATNFEAFITIFQQIPFHLYMFNSFVLAIMTTAIILVIASLAGYVFGRLDFPGRGPLMLAILAISYFPPAAFLLPLYDAFAGNPITIPFTEIALFSLPRLLNTPAAMVLPFSALFLPLSIFILTTFYGQIPDGLEDAARVEGTTRLGALFRVIMPLSAPGVATAAVLTFISVYNEYFFSQLMTTTNAATDWSPIVGGLLSFQTQYTTSYNLMAAASVVGVIPVVILVIIAQEKIVSGLTAGALKE